MLHAAGNHPASFCMQIGSKYLLTNLHTVAISRLLEAPVFCKKAVGIKKLYPTNILGLSRNTNKIVYKTYWNDFIHTKIYL